MFFLRRIYIVFLAFFTYYQYAMEENNKEENGKGKERSSSNNSKNEQSEFISILTEKRSNLDEKIEIEKDEKNNFNTQKYKDNYKKVEEYVCKIDPRVQEKYKKIDKKIEKEEGILSYKGGKNLKDIGETKTKIFYNLWKQVLKNMPISFYAQG